MYETLVPRGNETLRLGATLQASLRALASFLKADAGSTTRTFMLPGLYVTLPVISRPSIGLITHVIQSVVMLTPCCSQSVQRCVSFLRQTRVTYITLDVLYNTFKCTFSHFVDIIHSTRRIRNTTFIGALCVWNIGIILSMQTSW